MKTDLVTYLVAMLFLALVILGVFATQRRYAARIDARTKAASP